MPDNRPDHLSTAPASRAPPARQRGEDARNCRLANWTPWPLPNPSLIGHADVVFAGGWRVDAIPIFKRGDGSFSAGVPNAPQMDRDGRQRTNLAGKKIYTPLLQFETALARERWQAAVLGALRDGGITPAEPAAIVWEPAS